MVFKQMYSTPKWDSIHFLQISRTEAALSNLVKFYTEDTTNFRCDTVGF